MMHPPFEAMLSWKKMQFRKDTVFECEDFPSTFYWLDDDSHCLRIGDSLYKMPRKKGDTYNFEKTEKFIIRRCEALIEKFNEAQAKKEKFDNLDDLELLLKALFK